MSPNLKPRRMPCFTHRLTRHATGLDASGSAARTCPDESASRRRANTARAWSRSADGPAATSSLISCSSMLRGSVGRAGLKACTTSRCSGRPEGLHYVSLPVLYQGALQQAERLEHAVDPVLRSVRWRDHRQAED